MNKKISIILCTYNEVNYIEKCISLVSKTLKNAEIIVVDDNSNDGTLEKLDKLKLNFNFKLFVRKNERGLASAQKRGFQESKGEYVGTIDINSADQISYLKKMVAKFKVPGSIVVVTPDGPRGPAKQAKSGAFRVAKKNNVQIVACGFIVTRYWRIPSWDRTIIPKPFSKIYLKFSSPLSSGSEINTKSLSLFINDNQEALEKDVC